ncbi:MAG: amidohydrolase family protein [Bacteroidales bacterium]|nr:amidohydrolase family protein [Bacteroidales bacterium]
MRRISAHYIITNHTPPLKNGILEIDEKNYITNILDTKGKLHESKKIEFYNGIICPGFVNTHCHLELSHLKNKIPEKSSLSNFLISINQQKELNKQKQFQYIKNSEKEMAANGIVAVGDICNSDNTFKLKKTSNLKYHSFIELYGLDNNNAEDIFNNGKELYNKYQELLNLSASLTPHAPYSVSNRLFQYLQQYIKKNKPVISMHNQESEDENLYFHSLKGKFPELFNVISKNHLNYKATGKTSVQSVFKYIINASKILLVHNTYISKEDLDFIKPYLEKIFFVICINSNLFIEKKIPPIELIKSYSNQIAIGTDSLASNSQLSVLEEIKTISKHYQGIPLDELIKWATLNGAKALNFDDRLGSFEIGKKPEINLIYNLDLMNLKLTETSAVKVII